MIANAKTLTNEQLASLLEEAGYVNVAPIHSQWVGFRTDNKSHVYLCLSADDIEEAGAYILYNLFVFLNGEGNLDVDYGSVPVANITGGYDKAMARHAEQVTKYLAEKPFAKILPHKK